MPQGHRQSTQDRSHNRPDDAAPQKKRTDRKATDRHHGGQEPPDELQDRPEQNAGYDEAVRVGPAGEPGEPASVERLPAEDGEDLEPRRAEDVDDIERADDSDRRAERNRVADDRRRERENP